MGEGSSRRKHLLPGMEVREPAPAHRRLATAVDPVADVLPRPSPGSAYDNLEVMHRSTVTASTTGPRGTNVACGKVAGWGVWGPLTRRNRAMATRFRAPDASPLPCSRRRVGQATWRDRLDRPIQ